MAIRFTYIVQGMVLARRAEVFKGDVDSSKLRMAGKEVEPSQNRDAKVTLPSPAPQPLTIPAAAPEEAGKVHLRQEVDSRHKRVIFEPIGFTPGERA